MAVSHVKSNIVPDFTGTVTVFNSAGITETVNATALVRPSDWNSVHNQYMTISGNIGANSTASGSNIVFQAAGNISLFASTDTVIFSAPVQTVQTQGMVSVQGSTGAIVFSNSNNVTFGGNASTITASASFNQTVQTQGSVQVQGSTGAISFANANGVTFGANASTITASHNGLTTARASNDAIGLNTALTANGVAWTVNSSGLSLNVPAFLTTAAQSDHSHGNPTLALTNLSGTTNSASNGFTLSLSAAAPGGGAAISAAGGSQNTGTVIFSNSNGISFGYNAGTITATVNPGAAAGIAAVQAGTQTATSGTITFGNSNGITFGMSGSSQITASHNGLTTARASTDGIGLNTAQTNVTWTVNSGGLSFNAAGYAGTATTFNGTNISGSMTLNSNGLRLDLSGGAGGGGVNSGTFYAQGNTTQSSSGTIALSSVNVQGAGGVSAGISNGSIVVSGPSLTSLAATGALSASSNGSTISLGVGTVTASIVGNTTQTSTGTVNLNGLVVSGAGGLSAGISAGTLILSGATGGGGGMGISAGTQSVSTGTMVFSNSNGITFGMSGSSRITASYDSTRFAGTGTSATNASITLNSNGLAISVAAGGGVNPAASASNGSFAFTTLNFSNANNVTFGTSAGGIITASVAPPGAAAENNWHAMLGANTAGNTTASGSTIGISGLNLTLSGTNNSQIVISAPATSSLVGVGNVSISTAGSTISLIGLGGTATLWQPFNEGVNVAGQIGNASMHIVPLPTPAPAALGELEVDRLCIPLVLSNSTNSSGTVTLSHSFGLYSRTSDSLSLAFSTSATLALTFSGTVNNSTYAGIRLMTVPWTTTVGDGRYYVAQWSRTTTGGGNATFNQMLVSQLNSNFSGIFGQNSNRSNQWPLGYGIYSASFTTAMPSSIAFSQIDGTASIGARPPSFFMINGTA